MMNKYGTFVGRVLLGLLFLVAGVNKLMAGVDGTAGMIESAGLPLPVLLAWIAIAIEIIGGAALILGWKTKQAAGILAAFTVLITLIYHADFPSQLNAFLKNAAIVGGLLYAYVHGAGTMAMEK
jgi:putative oxidoreductase